MKLRFKYLNLNNNRSVYNKEIIVIGSSSYVGLSNAVLLAQHNEVVVLDIIQGKVVLINNRQSLIADYDIERFLARKI